MDVHVLPPKCLLSSLKKLKLEILKDELWVTFAGKMMEVYNQGYIQRKEFDPTLRQESKSTLSYFKLK